MKINSLNSQHLTHALHLQFASEAKGIIEKFNPSALKISPQYEILRASIEKEDLCYKIIRKSELSEAKEDADRIRDAVVIGINDAVRTALRHFDPAVSGAAKRLKIVLDTYNSPKSLTLLPYDAETAAIVNLLQEFEGKYAADIQVAGLTAWVSELHERNSEFELLAKNYIEQQSAKPSFRMKDARNETDDAYKKIVLVVSALTVMEGETAYAPFVNELNALIKHYSDLIAQRLGRRKLKVKN
ncbi:MAG: DUF6261 family protein [Prevotellaceae bacterium]|jgi:hypothetical protein|nr:DUF6261 family protein [Prevotellaceae bacterium]